MYTLFDIETIPRQDLELPKFSQDNIPLGNLKDPEKIKAKIDSAKETWNIDIIKKYSVTPGLCEIVSFAYMSVQDDGKILEQAVMFRPQIDFLFSEIIKAESIISWNGKNFDLPVIWKQSIINNHPINFQFYLQRIHKFNQDLHIDLMHVWNNFDYGKMSNCAEQLGIHCKKDFNGSMVYNAYLAGEYEKITEYNLQDVDVLYQISKRLGIF